MRRTHYSEHTASKIRACIRASPGLRAKDIAERVGLRRETVNAYLYSKQPGALGNRVVQDNNYGWYFKEEATPTPNDYRSSPNRSLGRRIKSGSRRTSSHKVSSYSTVQSISSEPPLKPPVSSYTPSVPPRDREAAVFLTLAEAFQGTQKILSFSGESVVVDVPSRTRPGTKLCVEGKGFYNPDRTQRGNLYLQVEAAPDDVFRLIGNDVMCDLSLAPTLAEQGGKIQVLSLEGAVKVTVPAGVRSGQLLRLIGKGWENAEGERGNLLLKVLISAPEASSAPFSIHPDPPEQPLEISSAVPLPVVPQGPPKQYSIEAMQQVFRRDDFNTLNDEEQGKLAQMLQEAERNYQRIAPSTNAKSNALTLRSRWFWIAVLLGGTLTFTALQFMPRFIPPSAVPTQNSNR